MGIAGEAVFGVVFELFSQTGVGQVAGVVVVKPVERQLVGGGTE